MAVAVDTFVNGSSTTSTSISWSHTCSGSNRLIVAAITVAAGISTDTASATYNGVSMTSAGKVYSNNSNDGYVQLFYLVAPASGANTVQMTSSANKLLIAGSVSFTGVDQATPTSGATTNFGSSGTPTVNITSTTGDIVVDAVCNGSSITSSNQTQQWRTNVNGNSAAGNAAQSTASGAASVTMSYATSSDWWGIVGINIKADAGGGGGGGSNGGSVAWLRA